MVAIFFHDVVEDARGESVKHSARTDEDDIETALVRLAPTEFSRDPIELLGSAQAGAGDEEDKSQAEEEKSPKGIHRDCGSITYFVA